MRVPVSYAAYFASHRVAGLAKTLNACSRSIGPSSMLITHSNKILAYFLTLTMDHLFILVRTLYLVVAQSFGQ